MEIMEGLVLLIKQHINVIIREDVSICILTFLKQSVLKPHQITIKTNILFVFYGPNVQPKSDIDILTKT